MLDYVIVAHDPDRVAIGDHCAESRQDAIDFATHFLDAEERNGVSVTITVIDTNIDYDLAANSHDHAGLGADSRQELGG